MMKSKSAAFTRRTPSQIGEVKFQQSVRAAELRLYLCLTSADPNEGSEQGDKRIKARRQHQSKTKAQPFSQASFKAFAARDFFFIIVRFLDRSISRFPGQVHSLKRLSCNLVNRLDLIFESQGTEEARPEIDLGRSERAIEREARNEASRLPLSLNEHLTRNRGSRRLINTMGKAVTVPGKRGTKQLDLKGEERSFIAFHLIIGKVG